MGACVFYSNGNTINLSRMVMGQDRDGVKILKDNNNHKSFYSKQQICNREKKTRQRILE